MSRLPEAFPAIVKCNVQETGRDWAGLNVFTILEGKVGLVTKVPKMIHKP